LVFGKAEPEFQPTISAVGRYVAAHAEDFQVLALDQANILAAAAAADDEARVDIVRILTLGGYVDDRGYSLAFLEVLDQALAYLQAQMEAGALDEERLKMLLNLLGKRGNAHLRRGEAQAACEAYKAALSLTDKAALSPPDKPRLIAILSSLIGKALSLLGEQEQARGHFDRARGLAREVGDDSLLGFVLSQESAAAGWSEDYDTARRVAAQEVEIGERLVAEREDDETWERLVLALVNLGSAELDLARRDGGGTGESRERIKTALATHERAQQLAEASKSARLRAHALSALAQDHHALGQREIAAAYFRQARTLWEDQDETQEVRKIDAFLRENGYDEVDIE
jgi:tetratricopeptide (TPR) repeat protein